ncbi:MAG: flavin reductase family protein [Pseudomonadota bacterium]
MSSRDLTIKGLFGCFAAGVTVVTTMDKGENPRGMTVSSFSAVSLEPPLILYCLGDHAVNFSHFADADDFAVNILSEGQQSLSNRFADASQPDWPTLAYRTLTSSSPVLDGCLGTLDCRQLSTTRQGDHLVIIGEVVDSDGPYTGAPLIYHRGLYLT